MKKFLSLCLVFMVIIGNTACEERKEKKVNTITVTQGTFVSAVNAYKSKDMDTFNTARKQIKVIYEDALNSQLERDTAKCYLIYCDILTMLHAMQSKVPNLYEKYPDLQPGLQEATAMVMILSDNEDEVYACTETVRGFASHVLRLYKEIVGEKK